jgi:transposase
LQTSDALGAVAAQLGPDTQAAIVELNKQGGLSYGKVTRCLESLFGIPLSRGGSVHTALRAAARCEPVYEAIRQAVGQSEVHLAVDFLSQLLRGAPVALAMPP